MAGRERGFALVLGRVEVLNPPLDPRRRLKAFHAPQSFRFLTPKEFHMLTKPPERRLSSR